MQSKDSKDTIRIQLTEEQKQQIRETIGQEATGLEFSVQELEERITPRTMVM